MSPILILFIPVLLFSVIIHECAHGLAAYRCGDDTAKLMGRITLNPIPHIDPFWSILIPILMIISARAGVFIPLVAGAKPVPVNPLNFNKPSRDEIIVSAAGPLSNIALALTAVLMLSATSHLAFLGVQFRAYLAVFFIIVIWLNSLLATFNLLPIPPLDGSHILANLLPYRMRHSFKMFSNRIGFFLLIGMIYFGILGYVFTPVAGLVDFAIKTVSDQEVLYMASKIMKPN